MNHRWRHPLGLFSFLNHLNQDTLVDEHAYVFIFREEIMINSREYTHIFVASNPSKILLEAVIVL